MAKNLVGKKKSEVAKIYADQKVVPTKKFNRKFNHLTIFLAWVFNNFFPLWQQGHFADQALTDRVLWHNNTPEAWKIIKKNQYNRQSLSTRFFFQIRNWSIRNWGSKAKI